MAIWTTCRDCLVLLGTGKSLITKHDHHALGERRVRCTITKPAYNGPVTSPRKVIDAKRIDGGLNVDGCGDSAQKREYSATRDLNIVVRIQTVGRSLIDFVSRNSDKTPVFYLGIDTIV